MVLVLAGPNGSGKSTITQYFEKVGEYTNADDIVLSTGMIILKQQNWLMKKDIIQFLIRKTLHLKQCYLLSTRWIS